MTINREASRLRHHRPARHPSSCAAMLFCAVLLLLPCGTAGAHPLGNFTINHFARLELDESRINVRYVVDMAEVAAFQALQQQQQPQQPESAAATTDGGGDNSTPSEAALSAYLDRAAAAYADGLVLTLDGVRLPLQLVSKRIMLPPGAGGLPTLRVETEFTAAVPPGEAARKAHRLRFENLNHRERTGWREIVVAPAAGVTVFDSSAYGSALTDEIREYPDDMLSAPLDERSAELSFTRSGNVPAGAAALRARDGRPVGRSRDRLAELIAVPEVTPAVALLGLLIATALGALHALSPGHGKAVVGAYLVGSRGTARHALFLGLTVTVTHTIGVFALGLVTLFASQYVVPEQLFPILSFTSGGIVLVIGLTLFVRRLRAALGYTGLEHAHDHLHSHDDGGAHDHDHAHAASSHVHSHGGRAHSHLPPGADGTPVTWRSLLGLGISGGLLPCPSALVVLLAAISLHRVGYGLLLVVAFSIGLASTLTFIGLAFVYAGRLMKSRVSGDRFGLVRVLPAASAFIIMCVGAAICYEALGQAGVSLARLLAAPAAKPATTISAVSVLTFGFIIGLKHAVEADHLAAVSTIVTERKSILSSSLVGGLWGVGHTISLFIAGVAVILLHVRISEKTALMLEFGVAIMLIALGVNALRKLVRPGVRIHLHHHRHGGRVHVHPHIHDESSASDPHTHHHLRLGARPLIIGMVHGLAGSAALMLLVLSTIPSPLIGLAYILFFGIGSVGGMMLMSVLVGLPLHFTAGRFDRANLTVRGLAGLFSLGFGIFMVYEIGFIEGLFR